MGAGLRTALAAVCIAALTPVTPSAHAAFPGQNGRIAFTTARDAGNFEIYSMDADGSGLVNLTNSTAYEDSPGGSSDGLKIVFSSHRDGNPEIYSMNVDGTGAARLTNNPASETYPTWSPDGTKIAFVSDRDGDMEIYTMNADGTGQVKRTKQGGRFDNVAPSWSPDGTKIAFESARGRSADIYTMNPDGSGLSRLTADAQNAEPSWSPDGTKIVFRSNRDDPSPVSCGLSPPPYCIIEIYTMNADGSAETRITNNLDPDFEPAWSPDGTRIAFTRITGGNYEVYVMNADGTGQTNITNDPTFDSEPYWLVNASYVRPKGATPFSASLTVGYEGCTAPNRTHGPPLVGSSCSPPTQFSHYATVGTPDANGQPSKSVGSVRMETIVGDPATAVDEADAALAASATDIRSKADLSDYTGELQVAVTVRITDRANGGPSGTDAGTVSDLPFSFTVPCAATPDTTVGSTCAASTTADALVPNTIREGKRAIWELGQVQVQDGGEDGEGATAADNTLFLRQGVFVP